MLFNEREKNISIFWCTINVLSQVQSIIKQDFSDNDDVDDFNDDVNEVHHGAAAGLRGQFVDDNDNNDDVDDDVNEEEDYDDAEEGQ